MIFCPTYRLFNSVDYCQYTKLQGILKVFYFCCSELLFALRSLKAKRSPEQQKGKRNRNAHNLNRTSTRSQPLFLCSSMAEALHCLSVGGRWRRGRTEFSGGFYEACEEMAAT